MSMFTSASNAVASVFDTITSVGNAAQETVSIGTDRIHNRAKAHHLTDKATVQLSAAKTLTAVKEELEADEDLMEIFKSLEADW